MAGMSLQNIPSEILARIFSLVCQQDLVSLAVTCSRFHALATDRLYRSIVIIPDCTFALEESKSQKYEANDDSESPAGNLPNNSTQIIHISASLKLAHTLQQNSELAKKIRYFYFHCGHESSEYDIAEVQANFQTLLVKHCSHMLNYRIFYLDNRKLLEKWAAEPDEYQRFHHLLQNCRIVHLSSLEQLPNPSTVRTLSLDLDDNDLEEKVDITRPDLEYMHRVPELEFSSVQGFGLDALLALQVGPCKLQPLQLTINHCHSKAEEIFENEDLEDRVKLDKKIDFSVLESKVDIPGLARLNLNISCTEHDTECLEAGCTCFGQFFDQFARFLTQNGGLALLEELHLSLDPTREWFRPHDLLEGVLSPASTFIKTLANLRLLKLSLSTSTFKMYSESGMSPVQLNRVNTRLVEAFFLSLGPQVTASLTRLELPDFLMAFFFYKPNFMESTLHTCQCSGCSMVLQELEQQFLPIYDDDDGDLTPLDNDSALYIIVGLILDKLQNEREVVAPLDKHTGKCTSLPMYGGPANILIGNLSGSSDDEALATGNDLGQHDDHGRDSDKIDKTDKNDTAFDIAGVHSTVTSAHPHRPNLQLAVGEIFDTKPEASPHQTSHGTLASAPTAPALDVDALVTTYILHQVRPLVNFLAQILPSVQSLMVHGLHYQRRSRGQPFVPVYDHENYPPTLFARGHVAHAGGRYGHFVFE